MTSTHCTYCQGRSRSLLHNNMTAILLIYFITFYFVTPKGGIFQRRQHM